MKNIKISSAFFAVAILVSSLIGCSKDYENDVPTIANIAVSNPAFSTLEGAAIRGGVAVVLSNANPNDPSGNYTVFAPTNDAFARLGLNSEEDLGVLQVPFLTNTLLYHVSNGNLAGSAITAGGSSMSALAVKRRFLNRGSDKYINGSKILEAETSVA